MQKMEVPKEGTRTIVTYTRTEIWMKFIGLFMAGGGALFGYQKMPIVNESTKISEAVNVVRNMNPDQLSALQGMQVASLEKQVKQNLEVQVKAIEDLKAEMKVILRDYDERTTKRLDKNDELILNNIKSIARLEAISPKARGSQQ